MPGVRIWFRKQLRVDHLNFRPFEMLKLGAAGLAAVKNRLRRARVKRRRQEPPDSRAQTAVWPLRWEPVTGRAH
jgi:hypothetical protein